jgi:hypothetical protein
MYEDAIDNLEKLNPEHKMLYSYIEKLNLNQAEVEAYKI